MQRAERVQILSADEYHRRGPGAMELAGYLALHGIQTEAAQFRPIEKDVGRGLLEGARAFGADFMAMGAYSHSRLRQLILGGVTRHVLENATIPVLMNR
jgi:nucleotide-binding universal stress UspA family protein